MQEIGSSFTATCTGESVSSVAVLSGGPKTLHCTRLVWIIAAPVHRKSIFTWMAATNSIGNVIEKKKRRIV